jgi:hypothetical protein
MRLLRLLLPFVLLMLTFSGDVAAQEGGGDVNPGVFTIGEQTFTSNYPEGMTFTVQATRSGGPIARASLFYDFGIQPSGRVPAETMDNQSGTITAVVRRADAGGLIPWLEVNYHWRLIDSAGNAIETPVQHAVYADNSREWQHAESDLVRIYWFGLPAWVGPEAIDAVNQAQERWRLGFPGVELTTRPLVVIYPDRDSFMEWQGELPQGSEDSIRFVGTLRESWNGTVQRVPDQLRLDRTCGGLDIVADFDHVVRALARATVTHELTHFHQYAMNSDRGPTWWIEGQATFFEDDYQEYDGDARVARLAAMGELPSLLYGDTLPGAGTPGPDGCTHLAYDVGAAFLRYLRDHYGGYAAHGEITRLVAQNRGIYEAIETVTGRSFADLEAEWRASLGAGPAPTLVPTPTLTIFSLPTPVFNPPGGG